MFNFFLENNDIFKAIDREDELDIDLCLERYLVLTYVSTAVTFGSIFFVD